MEIDVIFKGTLRDKQAPIIKNFLDSCEDGPFKTNTRGGIISVPCGWGKTIMALYFGIYTFKIPIYCFFPPTNIFQSN